MSDLESMLRKLIRDELDQLLRDGPAAANDDDLRERARDRAASMRKKGTR